MAGMVLEFFQLPLPLDLVWVGPDAATLFQAAKLGDPATAALVGLPGPEGRPGNTGPRGESMINVIFAQATEPNPVPSPAIWFDTSGAYAVMKFNPGTGTLGRGVLYFQSDEPDPVPEASIWFRDNGAGPMTMFISQGA